MIRLFATVLLLIGLAACGVDGAPAALRDEAPRDQKIGVKKQL